LIFKSLHTAMLVLFFLVFSVINFYFFSLIKNTISPQEESMLENKEIEDYFRKRDHEKLKEYRGKLKKIQLTEEKEARKKLHFMHCPKCGAEMQIVKLEGIEVDKCSECIGIYFDNEELEKLLEIKFERRKTVFQKIFGLK